MNTKILDIMPKDKLFQILNDMSPSNSRNRKEAIQIAKRKGFIKEFKPKIIEERFDNAFQRIAGDRNKIVKLMYHYDDNSDVSTDTYDENIIIANWNRIDDIVCNTVAKYGFNTVFDDEYILCSGCYRYVFTGGYSRWVEYHIFECECYCSSCINDDTYLQEQYVEQLIESGDKVVVSFNIKWEEIGWENVDYKEKFGNFYHQDREEIDKIEELFGEGDYLLDHRPTDNHPTDRFDYFLYRKIQNED